MTAEEIDGYLSLVKEYGSFFAEIYVNPVLFFSLVGIIIAVYTLRFFMITQQSKDKCIKKGVWGKYKLYILAHTLIQFLTCLFVAYLVIKFTNAALDNYIINLLISWIVGLGVSIIFDYKVVMPLENRVSVFINPLLDNKKETEGNKEDVDTTSNNITINIGNKEKEDTKKETKEENTMSTKNNIVINESTDDIIKTIIDVQEVHSEELKKQSEILNAIKESILNDKRVLLKQMIYDACDKGFVTPDEDERIRLEYKSYRGLNGNGYIKEIYENKFSALPVHGNKRD